MFYQRLKRATADNRFTCAYFHEATPLLERPIEDVRNEFYDAILMQSEHSAVYILPFLPFLGHGLPGIALLQDGSRLLKNNRQQTCRILDLSKIALENTTEAADVARFAFHACGADAVIIAPHRGYEPLAPLFAECNHGVLIDLRDVKADLENISQIANQKNCCANCGVVVRVESPADIYLFRRHSTQLPMIFATEREPDDLEDLVRAAFDTEPRSAPCALLTPPTPRTLPHRPKTVFQDDPTAIP